MDMGQNQRSQKWLGTRMYQGSHSHVSCQLLCFADVADLSADLFLRWCPQGSKQRIESLRLRQPLADGYNELGPERSRCLGRSRNREATAGKSACLSMEVPTQRWISKSSDLFRSLERCRQRGLPWSMFRRLGKVEICKTYGD